MIIIEISSGVKLLYHFNSSSIAFNNAPFSIEHAAIINGVEKDIIWVHK